MTRTIYDAATVFPERLKHPVLSAAKQVSDLYEIRFVAERAVYFSTSEGIRFVNSSGYTESIPGKGTLVPTRCELEEMTDRAAGFSGFFYEKQLKEGFITYGGACRMGICTSSGTDNFSSGTINSVSVRIPCFSTELFADISGELSSLAEKGLLVAGPPSSGKTTLLRIIALKLSDAFLGQFRKVSVIDERGELSGGKPLGFCTDIIGGKSKSSAILHAVRLMSPDYVICDEIGTSEEAEAILQGLNSGIRFIASMHAGSLSELVNKKQFRLLFFENVFSCVALLHYDEHGREADIFTKGEIMNEIRRYYGSLYGDRSYRDIFPEYSQKKTEAFQMSC